MTSINHHIWGQVIKAKLMELNNTLKIIQSQDGRITKPGISLSYIPSSPMSIFGWCKEKQSLVQYITVEEANDT